MRAELPPVTQLTDIVTRILGLNPGSFTLQGTNTYLIGTGKSRILLDTGEGKPSYLTLLASTLSLHQLTISDIVLSHFHLDHVGGVSDIISYYGSNNLPLPRIHKYPHAEDKFKCQPLEDGQVIKTEGATLRVVTTPGHTEDHIAFFLEEERTIFSGDCVLGQGTTVFTDLKAYMDSLLKMKSLQPTKIYPGHGPVVQDAISKLDEYYRHRVERENQIIKVMTHFGGTMTAREIVEVIYKDYPKNVWKAAERGIIIHLQKLEEEGRVERLDGGKWVLKSEAKC
ncbi:1038_t:CDS:2 [Paraglomus occultum]|uniref:1038_t:CDS:1 n=1 Tax=Paraglomus occultum TaxID=144539 RepID=A0A9N9FK14_9GLOM|nr:1038_t:CDS:2 [Paraglomus occultum]